MATSSLSSGCVRFDQFQVDLSSGELFRSGQPIHLQDQPFQILRLLLEADGKVVTREQLCAALWPADTFVDYELGLNTAVKKLRQALEDIAEHPRFIETLPKRGYRFIAPIEWVTETKANEALHIVIPIVDSESGPWETKPIAPKTRRWTRKTVIAVAVCVAVVASLYPWIAPRLEWILRQNKLRQLTVVPLTTLPGHVRSPTFSPDGSQIAFTWHDDTYAPNLDLYAKVIGNDKPERVTHWPDGFYALWAAWSPDGKNIAICRAVKGSGTAIVLISPSGWNGAEGEFHELHGPLR